ncbi:cysteine protease StiP family protein [Bacillus sp. S/N-304-OC-R1]|uniref:cysteine protease StiP family protein n=1 Tax=Bacillus sp. S/N-304-OC-R1 TaxID=2758034 RepID=UPI001C8DFF53|nr:cysteine protease StiP family protein [Bacillus sp. S/N-304-OC-R1]MBY0122699.1 cysteine protease StiP family protein [Bacillus sp. S/N-304-OC-R1]
MNKQIDNAVKFGSYDEKDVIFLLKNLSGYLLEGSVDHREMQIQQGQHYSETLPIEYQPPAPYMELFRETLLEYKQKVALCTGIVAEQIYKLKGENTVLVSLARAGTPIGILIKRYIKERYHIELPHYSISIIRDRGLDENAIKYILKKHPDKQIQFIDGWTGKGAISIELTKACNDFFEKYGVLLDDTLAVVADPGHCTTLYGTREDFLIPSACLNSTVSGLVSRTVLNKDLIGPDDFHGAKYYKELTDFDVSNDYLNVITDEFAYIFDEAAKKAQNLLLDHDKVTFQGMQDVLKMKEEFNIEHTNYIKPGVGETTRVLLRRIPWKILMKDIESPYVRHILLLAKERNVEVVHYPDMSYTCCGLIKKVGKI